MSSVKTPQEKKLLAYGRDHYAKSKYDKARKAWRRKKAKARRSYRRKAESLTKAATVDQDSDSRISAVEQRRVRRWDYAYLRERIVQKKERRIRSFGAKKQRRVRHSLESAAS